MIPLNCNWQNVIDAIPCLCWGVIILSGVFLILKCTLPLIIQKCYERKMIQEAFEREKWWAEKKENKNCSDESLNKKIDELTQEVEKQRRQLKVELSRQDVLQKHLEEYKQHLKIIMSNTKGQ